MTNEQKVQLLKGMVKVGELLKKCHAMLEAETNERKYLFGGSSVSKVSYECALENMLEELDRELAEASGVYGDGTIPDYDIPTVAFNVGVDYNAWISSYEGEGSGTLTLVGRKGEVLYFKHGDNIIRGKVFISKRDTCNIEETYLEWQSKAGIVYCADLAANDRNQPVKIKDFYLRHMGLL